jgi:phage shock protein A
MATLERIKRVLSSNVNSVLDKVENPAKLADQALIDMDKALKDGKRALTEGLAEVKLHEQRAAALRKDADTWHARAATALKAGDESLARDVLRRRHELLTQAVAEDEAARAAREEHEEMNRFLGQLQVQRDIFSSRKATIVAEAQLRKAEGKGLAGRLGQTKKGPSALDRYDEIEKGVENAEAAREVDELLGVGKDAELEARLRQIDANTGVDDELSALKARLDRK